MAEKGAEQDDAPGCRDGHIQQQLNTKSAAAASEPLQTAAEPDTKQTGAAAKETKMSNRGYTQPTNNPETLKPSQSDISAIEAQQGASSDQEEVQLLHLEATEAVKEIGFAVRHAYKSTSLTSTDQTVYINVQTKEECTLCLELSLQGFRVVGHKFDQVDRSCYSRHYETIYALLDDLSLGYRQSFGETLQNRLEALALEQRAEETQAIEGD